MNEALWTPSPERIRAANITRFAELAGHRLGVEFVDYASLHAWSVAESGQFWNEIWDQCAVIAQSRGDSVMANPQQMPGARWYPDARLNFAENLLRRRDHSCALIFHGEDQVVRELSFIELHDQVSRLAQALRDFGVVEGDRVAGYMPNMPETIIAMLATTSLGAIWSSCSPDFGVQGVVDRFGQITPKVLFTADGYFYAGKAHDCLSKVKDVLARIESIAQVIVVPYVSEQPALDGLREGHRIDELLRDQPGGEITFNRVDFNHPLYIMYSSGTTGVPKCIVHGTGGTLLKHLSEHYLHTDVMQGDRLFYFTTCGWMMWNWMVSGLACGATLVLYDGSPFHPGPERLFDLADATGINIFGTSAKYIDAVKKSGLVPKQSHDLSSVRSILSTGSPLVPESFDFVYESIKSDLCLSSITGGTDIVGCFALGNPALPVYRGELQCLGLGLDVRAFDDSGEGVIGEQGELVCVKPFPSMPVAFWDDDDGSRYRAAYFEKFPGVWCHGDWVSITERGTLMVFGRSDATLNPGGVRIGTAEIYRQVEQLEEVIESLVIGQDFEGDVRVVLFVVLRAGIELDEPLMQRIRAQIRANTTARHVPARIVQVPDIPRTKSGKIVELAVRDVVHGRAIKNQEALANAEALEHFRNRAELSV
ncbi:MAG: acetoacetyl-CoA synthetase [Gammaproteobacteria bacterium]|jgi:acetoacetyl-CoA synthetase